MLEGVVNMKCLKCEAEIGECKVCPFCGYEKQTKDICIKCGKEGNSYYEGMCKECYDKTYGNEKKEDSKEKPKSNFLFWFQMIAIIVLSVCSLIMLISKYYVEAVYIIIILIIVCILCKTFSTIIDLLQSIDEKL
jgi:hypothetical protein